MAQQPARRVLIAVVGNLAGPLAAFVTAPVLARSLGVASRGDVAAATAPLLLATSMVTLGLPDALTFFAARSPSGIREHARRAFPVLAAAGVVGTIAIALLAQALSAGDGDLRLLIELAGVCLIPALVVAGVRGIAAGRHQWSLVTGERLLAAAARLILVLILALSGTLNTATATATIALTSIVGGLVYLRLPGRLRAEQHDDGVPEQAPETTLLSFGLRMWAGSLTGILLSRLDQTLMVPLASSYQLGLYAVAVSISEVTLVFNGAVRDVLFATESSGSAEGRLGRASRTSTLVTTIAAVAIGGLAVPGLPLLFGAQFAPATSTLAVLLLATVLGNPGSVAGAGLSGRNRSGLRSWSLAIAFVVNLAAVLLLVPGLGALGAAVATLVGNVVAGYLNIVWLRVFFGVPVREFLGVRRSDIRALASSVRGVLPIAGSRDR